MHERQAPRFELAAGAMLVVVLTVLGGCGGKDDSDKAATTTRAMVPDGTAEAGADSQILAPTGEMGADGSGGFDSPIEGGEPMAPDVLKPVGAPPVARPAPGSSGRAADAPAPGTFDLQLGSFVSADNANALAQRVRELGQAPEVEVATLGGQAYHRVLLRGLPDRVRAERLGETLRAKLGITYLIRQN